MSQTLKHATLEEMQAIERCRNGYNLLLNKEQRTFDEICDMKDFDRERTIIGIELMKREKKANDPEAKTI